MLVFFEVIASVQCLNQLHALHGDSLGITDNHHWQLHRPETHINALNFKQSQNLS